MLVLVHGAVIAARYMAPVGRRLGCVLQTCAPDLPGFGGSRHLRPPDTVAGFAEALRKWIETHTLRPVVLVGNSFGAQVATAVALSAPETVAGLVLIGPTIDRTRRTAAAHAWQSVQVVVGERPPVQWMWMRDAARIPPWRVIGVTRLALEDHIEVRLRAPLPATLVIRGSHDRLVSREWASHVAALSGGRAVEIEHAGHAAHFSRPDEVAKVILDFVRERVPLA